MTHKEWNRRDFIKMSAGAMATFATAAIASQHLFRFSRLTVSMKGNHSICVYYL